MMMVMKCYGSKERCLILNIFVWSLAVVELDRQLMELSGCSDTALGRRKTIQAMQLSDSCTTAHQFTINRHLIMRIDGTVVGKSLLPRPLWGLGRRSSFFSGQTFLPLGFGARVDRLPVLTGKKGMAVSDGADVDPLIDRQIDRQSDKSDTYTYLHSRRSGQRKLNSPPLLRYP